MSRANLSFIRVIFPAFEAKLKIVYKMPNCEILSKFDGIHVWGSSSRQKPAAYIGHRVDRVSLPSPDILHTMEWSLNEVES